MVRSWLGAGLGGWVLLVSAAAHAQCTMDTDCKGDRICEEGRCTAPSPPAAEAAPSAPAPAAAPVVATPPPPPSPPSTPLPPPPAPPPRAMVLVADPAPPKMVRHSTGMMVGGIVMVAIAPIALFVSAGAAVSGSFCRGSYDRSIDGSYYDDCDNDGLIYGSLFVGAALLGAGIPMIIVGAKKEPAKLPAATVAPWATSTAAGLGLRLAL